MSKTGNSKTNHQKNEKCRRDRYENCHFTTTGKPRRDLGVVRRAIRLSQALDNDSLTKNDPSDFRIVPAADRLKLAGRNCQ